MIRVRTVVLLSALGLYACSLQDFDALGAGVSTGGADQGVGGSTNGGESTAPAGGTGDTGGAMGTTSAGGTQSGGGSVSTGGKVGTGGTSTTGGASNTGGTAPVVGTLANPSFESGSTSWLVDPASELGYPNCTNCSAYVQGPIGTATVHQGSFQLSVYDSTRTYAFKVYQVVNGLTDGQYTLSGWFTRGAMTTAYLYATGCGGADPAHSAIPTNDVWTMVSVTDINVIGGRCEVGFYVEGNGADWLNADDFTFAPVATGDAG